MPAKTRTRKAPAAPRNGTQPAPKAGSPAQREMVEDLAQDIMTIERVAWRIEKDMAKRGDSWDDLCFQDGQRVVDDSGAQVTYEQRRDVLLGQVGNLEAAFPTLMPAVRSLIRKTRQQIDAQE